MALLAVLGMHRSGTSLVAGMLHGLGWDIGPRQELMPPKPDNPNGFVEHLPAVRINDRLLYRLGGSWADPPALPTGWAEDSSLDDLRDEASTVAARLVERHDRTLLKDPRLSLTLPFWQTVTTVDDAVLVMRDPRKVISSLMSREAAMTPTAATELWTRYVLAALRNDVRLHVVRPQAVLADPDEELVGLARALGHDADEEQLRRARDHVADGLWNRTGGTDERRSLGSATPVDDVDPALAPAVLLHSLIVGEDGARWRRALATLTTAGEVAAGAEAADSTRIELVAARDELAARADRLSATLAEVRESRERIRDERERARELHDAMRDQRDAALEQLAARKR